MSVSLKESSSLNSRFRDARPSLFWQNPRRTEIWRIDLNRAEWQVLEVILQKLLGLRAHTEIWH